MSQTPDSLYDALLDMRNSVAAVREHVFELQQIKEQIHTLIKISIDSGNICSEDIHALIDKYNDFDNIKNQFLDLIIDEQATLIKDLYEAFKECQDTKDTR